MRIVRHVDLQSDPYQVGQSGAAKAGGLPLKNILLKKAFVDNDKQFKALEEKILSLGLRQFESNGATLLQKEMRRLSDEYSAELEKTKTEMSAAIIDLSMEIAAKICRKAVSVDPSIVTEWVREALGRLGSEDSAVVKLHPSEADAVRRIQKELLSMSRGLKELVLQEDLTIEPGGCVVEGETVVVDATLPTRMLEVHRGLEAA